MISNIQFPGEPSPTPARRHMNPDGLLGGWVAETADVDATCYVSEDALIYGNAEVKGMVKVHDEARIHGDALVEGLVNLYGSTRVYGKAHINGLSGRVVLKGDSNIFGEGLVRGNVIATDLLVNQKAWVQAPDGGTLRLPFPWMLGGAATITGSFTLQGSGCLAHDANITADEEVITLTLNGSTYTSWRDPAFPAHVWVLNMMWPEPRLVSTLSQNRDWQKDPQKVAALMFLATVK